MASAIYIQATETDPRVAARAAWVERGQWLRAELEAKVWLATGLRLSAQRREQAREQLVNFATSQVKRYLWATDRTLYSVAEGAAETRLVVRGLRAHHQLLAEGIDRMERSDDTEAFAAAAHTLLGLLRASLHLEREVLLPAVAELPGVDLAGLLADWDTLLAGGVLEVPEVMDVREIPRGQRHPRIFAAFARLQPGGSFVLVNNHDPKHLRREFAATYPGHYRWDYLDSGPEQWRIRINRTSTTGQDRDDG